MNQKEWRQAMGTFATGVTVITTYNQRNEPLGMTANAVSSLSLDPTLLLVCVEKSSDTLQSLLDAGLFCVNILSRRQEDISSRFAKKGGAGKFDEVPFLWDLRGIPVLENCLTNISCSVHEVVEGGDHVIIMGEGLKIQQTAQNEEPLLFYKGQYTTLSPISKS